MANNRAETRPGAEKLQRFPVGIDQAIAEIAFRQEGRITREQMIALGASDDAIAHRVRSGRLHRLRRGLYAVGHRGASVRSRGRSALLNVGVDAVLSHTWAAAEWRIRLPHPAVVHVSSPRQLRSRDGIRLHRRPIDPAEIRHVGGLPLTNPARTLFDLGTMLGRAGHAKAANQAFVVLGGRLTIADLRTTQARNAGSKGSVAFRRLLETLDPKGREIRSPLEARLSAFLRGRGFPPWEQNASMRIGTETIKPDVLWRAQRVIVAADGRDPHLSPLTFDSDRRRDRRLRVEGWEPVRVTWRHLDAGADELESDLRILLDLPPPA